MATRLTQERVDKWNKLPTDRRETAFLLANGLYQKGMLDPRPLWRAGKIVLSNRDRKALEETRPFHVSGHTVKKSLTAIVQKGSSEPIAAKERSNS